MSMQRLKGMMTSNTPEWATPDWLYRALDAEFGFTLDPCATPENAKCANYFAREDDGLMQAWSGRVFINPPYGREIGQWVRKAFEAAQAGTLCVLLVPARTDTQWWHTYCVRGEIRYFCGRLKFGDGTAPAPFPSAVVVFRPKGL